MRRPVHSSRRYRWSNLCGGLLLVESMALFAAEAWGQISLTTPTGMYTQNFDTLPSSGTFIFVNDDSMDPPTLPGWYALKSGGTTGTTNGSATAGGLYSFGATGSSERALGSIGSATTATVAWGAHFVNNTGLAIDSITIEYFGEQWRDSGFEAPQTAVFSYRIGGTAFTAPVITQDPTVPAGWTGVTSLDFTSPVYSGTAGALNGNDSANRVFRNHTIFFGTPIAAGESFWIRWDDPNHINFDHGLATDDLKLSWTTIGGGPRNLIWNTNSTPPATEGGGVWQAGGATNWVDGSSMAASWSNSNPDNATFGTGGGAGGPHTVTISGSVTAGTITFAADSHNYVLADGSLRIDAPMGTGITANNSATISSAVVLGASQIWTVASHTLNVGGVVSEALPGSGLIKTGAGVLELAGNNTYNGGTTIAAGTLIASHNKALGDNAAAAVLLGSDSGAADAALLLGNGVNMARDITVVAGSSGQATVGTSHASGASILSGDLIVNRDVRLAIDGAAALDLDGEIENGAGAALVKTGTGTLSVNGTQMHAAGASLVVGASDGGTVNLNSNAGTAATSDPTPAVANLTITFGGEGRVNLGADQDLFGLVANIGLGGNQQIDLNSTRDEMGGHRRVRIYAPDTTAVQTTLRNEIANGQASKSGAGATATWDGIWDNTLGSGEGLGYGVQLDAAGNPHVLVRSTLLGDADLNGTVDSSDLSLLLSSFNQPDTHWSQGNFNFDPGGTNSSDLSLLLAGFNQAFAGGAATVQSVPEPSSMVLGVLGGCGLAVLVYRRRGRCR